MAYIIILAGSFLLAAILAWGLLPGIKKKRSASKNEKLSENTDRTGRGSALLVCMGIWIVTALLISAVYRMIPEGTLMEEASGKADTTVEETGKEGYRNEKWHFTLDIPESWEGKYQVCEEEDTIRFLQTATYEKYGTGTGCLFYITCIEGTKTQEKVDAMVDGAFPRPIIMQGDKVTYVYGMPTDVQYPIWVDVDAEDAEIAGEYEKMATDITYIIESIRPLAE